MPILDKKHKDYIYIKGAKVHNLKNIDILIPRDKFIVITGLSGSGKSSLAFDTIYAEGQRRYVESLSSYARQFLGRMNKPAVEKITGIPPSIAIEQKVNTRNPRSTVGTSSEIYDYLKLLYSRIGKTYSPVSNSLVQRHTVTDVVNYIVSFRKNTEVFILCPYSENSNSSLENNLEILLKQGITRIEINNRINKISDILKDSEFISGIKNFNILIDRIKVNKDEDSRSRYADSIQTAFTEGKGDCLIKVNKNNEQIDKRFSNRFEADGILFEEPSVHMFSFNNPVGACPKCEGYGKIIGIDEDAVIPNKSLSVYDNAIVCWKGEKMKRWKEKLILSASKFSFPIHKPYYLLSPEQKKTLWKGNKYFKGINAFFDYLERKNYKIQYRVMISRYRGKTTCPLCSGTRLKNEAAYVKIGNKSIQDLVLIQICELKSFFRNLNLSEYEHNVSQRLLTEIGSRLDFLNNVGLGYLTLNRLSSTLSGGESQRINLATALGSSLVGSLYILDEPSIGLHPFDTNNLINVLKQLQQVGNTVMVVEHDEDIIRAADEIIDLGPYAGRLGGEVVFQGNHSELVKDKKSITARYLTGKENIDVPKIRKKWNNYIEVVCARENNLKGINVKFPLNVITVISGVSGSGKTSLVRNILYSSLKKRYSGSAEKTGDHDTLLGDINLISDIEFIDQNPIGKSSRSNPATYIKAYEDIRRLYAEQKLSEFNGFKPSHFSFNVDGGRCEECQGEGIIKVEMQFMPDVSLLCESCNGKRFKEDILEITFKGKNIHEILELTVNESIEFFRESNSNTAKKIADKLQVLANVGLGYINLGQSSTTLSGGESQRIKLASFLGKNKNDQKKLFVFDEPTTGLHFDDIKKLLEAFNSLIKKGHSIIIIEHNPEIIKSADWVIDLGPGGGNDGGEIVFQGTPENIINCKRSYTGKFLKRKLSKNPD